MESILFVCQLIDGFKSYDKKYLYMFIFLYIAFIHISSASGVLITADLAKKAAMTQINILQKLETYRQKSSAKFDISEIRPLQGKDGRTLAYIGELVPIGYIVISANNDIRPIIAYSLSGEFSFEDRSDNVLLHLVLCDMENRHKSLPLLSNRYKEKNNILWENYLSLSKSITEEFSKAETWGPYLTTQWDQGYPFNKYCPVDPTSGERSVVGCNALAVAQILNYWEYPSTIFLSKEDRYTTIAKNIKIDEDCALYNFLSFEEMNEKLHKINYADDDIISALIFACGVFVISDYTSSGTGGCMMSRPFINKFGYSSASYVRNLDNNLYSSLQLNMKEGRPAILFMVDSKTGAGHLFIADGLKDTGEYHINFGWGGNSDGWYFLPFNSPISFDIIHFGITNIYPYPESTGTLLYYVDKDIPVSGDGRNWSTAIKSFEEAMWKARGVNAEIRVKQGRYKINTPLNNYGPKIALYGGFQGFEEKRDQRDWINNPTIIDGQNTKRCFINGQKIVLDGFTVCNGYCSENGYQGAGALYNSQGSEANIKNCIFLSNASSSGGAIFSDILTQITITNTKFLDNTATDGGAAINGSDSSEVTIINCEFTDNTSESWSGAIGVGQNGILNIADSIFLRNNAVNDGGGAIGANCYAEVTITDCNFFYNMASSWGSAICISPYAKLDINNSSLMNNTSNDGGGTIFVDYSAHVTATNCELSDNTANNGGAIYINSTGALNVTNCTFSKNKADRGGAIYGAQNIIVNIINSILWGNIAKYYSEIDISNSSGANVSVTYSDIMDGYPGEGNKDSDPLFFNPDIGDYHLQFGSPCIDSGINKNGLAEDMDGAVRPQDGNEDGIVICDMGAYEFSVLTFEINPGLNFLYLPPGITEFSPSASLLWEYFANRNIPISKILAYRSNSMKWMSFWETPLGVSYSEDFPLLFGEDCLVIYAGQNEVKTINMSIRIDQLIKPTFTPGINLIYLYPPYNRIDDMFQKVEQENRKLLCMNSYNSKKGKWQANYKFFGKIAGYDLTNKERGCIIHLQ